MGVIDDKKSRLGFVWPKVSFPFKVAYRIDKNIAIIWDHSRNIRIFTKNYYFMSIFIVALWECKNVGTPARRTHTASLMLNRIFADKCFRELKRKLPFPDALVTRKKQRIWHTAIR